MTPGHFIFLGYAVTQKDDGFVSIREGDGEYQTSKDTPRPQV